MGELVVKVNGRDFPLSCDDGQEPRIRRLVQYVDAKIAEYSKVNGSIGEARLILLAAIAVADELSDANEALAEARRRAIVIEPAAGGIRSIARRIDAVAAARESS